MDTSNIISIVVAFVSSVIAIFFGIRNYKLQQKVNAREKERYDAELRKEKQKERIKTLAAYESFILKEFRYISFRGVGIGGLKIELKDSYITLHTSTYYQQASYYNIEEYEKFISKSKKKDKKYQGESFEYIFKNETERKRNKFLVVGHPGSGKTTLLKWIALQCFEIGSVFQGYIPFYFPLKIISDNPNLIKRDLRRFMIYYTKQIGTESSIFNSEFENNNVLFLMDGLDEIASESTRRKTIEWLESQHIGNNHLIISSRFSGLNRTNLTFSERFSAFSIEDYSMEDVERFLENWYLKVETSEENSISNRERAKLQTTELINTLKNENYQSLREIAVNPLLLVLVAIIHYKRGKLPRYRYKLYEECIMVLADTWLEVNRGRGLKTNYNECLLLLSIVAVRMMIKNTRRATKKEMIEFLTDYKIESKKQEVFFDDVVKEAGILVESEGVFEFLHLTFQEYLAALYYSNSGTPLDILKYANQSYWLEPIKLFVNIGNTHTLFDHVIDNIHKLDYINNLYLWEYCLHQEITIESTRINIGRKYSKAIIELLTVMNHQDDIEQKISSLSCSYPIFQYSNNHIDCVLDLFLNAKHPYCKSIGASILHHNKKYNPLIDSLLLKIRERKISDPVSFLMENDNSISLIGFARRDVSDFVKLIEVLIEFPNPLTVYLILLELENMRLFKINHFQKKQEFDYVISLLTTETPDYINRYIELRKIRDYWSLKNDKKACEVLNISFENISYFYDLQNNKLEQFFKIYEDLLFRYEKKHKISLVNNKCAIQNYGKKILETISSMSSRKILKFFPNSVKIE